MKKDEFYVGYLGDQPKGIMRFVKSRVWLIAAILLISSFVFALFQKPFKNSNFELGSLTEVTGVLHKKPYPMLRVKSKEGSFKNVLLLGFGKFGAEGGIETIEEDTEDLEGVEISLKGTLIYYNGKTLLQLENNVEGTYKKLNKTADSRLKNDLGSIELNGEIIDPKCYFGVMKPGRGKIHRSCAVRCISGGMPPVFVTTNEKKETNYFLITNEEGEPINQELLAFVGKPVQLSGKMEQMEDWILLKVNPETGLKPADGYSKIYTP